MNVYTLRAGYNYEDGDILLVTISKVKLAVAIAAAITDLDWVKAELWDPITGKQIEIVVDWHRPYPDTTGQRSGTTLPSEEAEGYVLNDEGTVVRMGSPAAKWIE